MWTWWSQLLPDLIPCLKIFLRIIELFKHRAPQMKFPISLQFYVDKQNHWTFSLHCVSQRLHFILMNRALCGTFYKTFFWNVSLASISKCADIFHCFNYVTWNSYVKWTWFWNYYFYLHFLAFVKIGMQFIFLLFNGKQQKRLVIKFHVAQLIFVSLSLS